MSENLTEAEVMQDSGFGPPPVFVGYGPDNNEVTFGTIGAWQAFMDRVIGLLGEDQAGLRGFFGHNKLVMNSLEEQPQYRKAVAVIRAQFVRAMREG